MIPINVYQKIFPTLDKNLQAKGDTCRTLGRVYGCIGCVFETNDSCLLKRNNKNYRLFLEQHPEFLV